jgi:hypothetical protein
MKLEELVKLIEEKADDLAEMMVRTVRESPRMTAYHRFADDQLAARARLVYANLGNWLEESSEAEVEEEYYTLGEQRCRERIPLSQVIWALLLTRRNLWQFVDLQGRDTVSDLESTLELELLVVRFFDRAILHTVSGYESARDLPEAHRYAEDTSFWPGG